MPQQPDQFFVNREDFKGISRDYKHVYNNGEKARKVAKPKLHVLSERQNERGWLYCDNHNLLTPASFKQELSHLIWVLLKTVLRVLTTPAEKICLLPFLSAFSFSIEPQLSSILNSSKIIAPSSTCNIIFFYLAFIL